ncbi:MogA/MoaB family molybdenum cofactor biosynthesis protein [Solidesulfovibrio sp.]|uniref:MogA/MoaB family molybdenum cofactor biosynthesis protein n=1 Tax=Solidesulfovibrio sp. TaxID=2910990 RepID=UPI002B2030F5|nr:MogA/MoaB family molybdenum cofactor biosynthesis protein [Solidesulfovibrio sp.]MEA4858519.1 MogA/MoaB family molybdenum cofactor biosynthesis protein [Solidesulfovibrio sp.]
MPHPLHLVADTAIPLAAGDRLHLVETAAPELFPHLTAGGGRLPRLTVGTRLSPAGGGPDLLVVGVCSRPGEGDVPAGRVVAAKALADGGLPAGANSFHIEKTGLALAWITLSDKGSQGLRMDAAGPAIAETCAAALPIALAQGHIIPDEPRELTALLVDLAITQGFDLVVTTGGTGLSPRDTTPEATLAVLEKRLPGFEAAMLAASLAKTKHALLSRAVAGTLGQAIVVNVPGSPKAVRETLAAVLPAIPHGLDKLRGDPADCGQG